MKCLCGYEYIWDWDSEKQEEKITGDKKFIELRENILIEDQKHTYDGVCIVKGYACPKCGTLKIEV